MKVVRVVGPCESGRLALVERLVERLGSRGRVGTVTHSDGEPVSDATPTVANATDTAGTAAPATNTTRHRDAGAAVTYAFTADGGWAATGDGESLGDVLDRLAIECDYAVVEGGDGTRLPTVALGDADVGDGTTLTASATAEDVDVAAVVDALADVDPYETLESLVARVKRSADEDRAGAIATFTGRVRTRDGPDDEPTEYLTFQRYDEIAADRMCAIEDDLCAREGVFEVVLHHKVGVVEAGEDIVYVVVLAGHRAEAFRAVEDGIDRLKAEVPLFKKEVTVGDAFWAHESDE